MCLTVIYFDTDAYLDNNCDKSFGIIFSYGSEYILKMKNISSLKQRYTKYM